MPTGRDRAASTEIDRRATCPAIAFVPSPFQIFLPPKSKRIIICIQFQLPDDIVYSTQTEEAIQVTCCTWRHMFRQIKSDLGAAIVILTTKVGRSIDFWSNCVHPPCWLSLISSVSLNLLMFPRPICHLSSDTNCRENVLTSQTRQNDHTLSEMISNWRTDCKEPTFPNANLFFTSKGFQLFDLRCQHQSEQFFVHCIKVNEWNC